MLLPSDTVQCMKSTLVRPLAVVFIHLALLWNFVFPNDHFYDKMFSFFDESHVRNDLNYTVFFSNEAFAGDVRCSYAMYEIYMELIYLHLFRFYLICETQI